MPALILKTSGATQSILDREQCLDRLKHIKSQFPSDVKLPNVYLLHGALSDDEMNDLYNHHKIKAFYLLTHGEGFGRPLLEATMTGLPVIASDWSGHLDFLDKDKSILVDGELQQVPKSVVWKDIIVEESKWFVADVNKAAGALNFVFENYNKCKTASMELMKINRDKFTLKKMSEKIDSIIEDVVKDIPTQVSLNLPKLKKSKPTKPPEVTLPKLTKATSV